MKPLIKPASRRPLTLSFYNLVELFVLASMRRAHNVSMPRVRKALSHVEKQLGREATAAGGDSSPTAWISSSRNTAGW